MTLLGDARRRWLDRRRPARLAVTAEVRWQAEPTRESVRVTITNTGPTSATVTSWGFSLANGRTFSPDQPADAMARGPHVLAPLASLAFEVPLQELKWISDERAVPLSRFRPVATLDSGQLFSGPEGFIPD